jgi:hypothetical protein
VLPTYIDFTPSGTNVDFEARIQCTAAGGTQSSGSLNFMAGTVNVNSVPVVTTTGTQSLSNKTLVSPTVDTLADATKVSAGKVAGATVFTAVPYTRTGDTNPVQMFAPTLLNDLAYNIERGGTIAVTKNGVTLTPGVDYNPYAVFNNGDMTDGRGPGHARGMEFYGTFLATDTWVVTVGLNPSITAVYGHFYGVEHIHWFGAKDVKIEAYYNGAWSTIYDVTNQTTSVGEHWGYVQSTGNPVTQVRYTFTNLQAIGAGGCLRIRNIWMQQSSNGGFSYGYFTRGGGPLYGTNALPPKITATGSDANIDLSLNTKGTGSVLANSVPVVTTTGTQTLTNKTLTDAKISGTGFKAADGSWLAQWVQTVSAVNYPAFVSAATGQAVQIGAAGSDTNVSLNLTTKGTGTVQANGNPVVVNVAVPATATSAGVAGQRAYDASYVYVCTATNTWKRAALSTW